MIGHDLRSTAGEIAQAWDPYDVWLKRVKLPREWHAQRAPAVAGVQLGAADEARPTDPTADDSLLVPGVA